MGTRAVDWSIHSRVKRIYFEKLNKTTSWGWEAGSSFISPELKVSGMRLSRRANANNKLSRYQTSHLAPKCICRSLNYPAPFGKHSTSFFKEYPAGKLTLIFSSHHPNLIRNFGSHGRKSRNLVAKYDNKLGQTSTRRLFCRKTHRQIEEMNDRDYWSILVISLETKRSKNSTQKERFCWSI